MQEDIEYYLQRAQHLIDLERWIDAESELRQLLALDANYVDALSLLGMCIAFNGNVLDGIDLIQQAIAIDPNRSVFYWHSYKVYWFMWKWVEAKQSIEKAIELDPENSQYHGSLALIFYFLAEFRKLSISIGDRTLLKLGLDNRVVNLNDPEDKIDRSLLQISNNTAEIGLSYDPINELCLRCKTDSLVRLERYVEAEISGNILRSLAPNSDYVYQTLGEIYYGQNRWDESVASFLTALEIKPNDNKYIRSQCLSALRAKFLLRQKFPLQYQWLIDRADESVIYSSALGSTITVPTLIWFTPSSICMSLLLWAPLFVLWLLDDLPNIKLLNNTKYHHLFSQKQISDLNKRSKIVVGIVLIFIIRTFIPWNPTITNIPSLQ